MPNGLWGGGDSPDLLDTAKTTKIGRTFNVNGFRTFGLQVVLGGTVAATGCVVSLEFSNDGGTTWYAAKTWTKASQSSGEILFLVDFPSLLGRVNLTTLSGGTAPTVKAYVSGV